MDGWMNERKNEWNEMKNEDVLEFFSKFIPDS
jgi:hypothetical protein